MMLVVKNLPVNAGDETDTGSIPGSGRSPGVGNGNLLQYSCLGNFKERGAWHKYKNWASLVAQLVKNPPVVHETPVRFLCWEDPLEKGLATHSSILGLPLWLSW